MGSSWQEETRHGAEVDGSVSKEMQAEVVWDGTGSGAGSGSAAGPGRFLEQSRVLRRLSDCSRIAARGHGDARDRVSALIVLPSSEGAEVSRMQGPRSPRPRSANRRRRPPALTAAARPHSPPPASAGSGAALHGSRLPAPASVCLSLGTAAGVPAPPPPPLRRGRK